MPRQGATWAGPMFREEGDLRDTAYSIMGVELSFWDLPAAGGNMSTWYAVSKSEMVHVAI
jgi:hypothetical protein